MRPEIELSRRAVVPSLARSILFALLAALGAVRPCVPSASAQESAPPPPQASKEKAQALLDKWVFEPIALEDMLFRLHIDRRDGSFFFEDRRTGERWFSPTTRRGFASLLLRNPVADEPPRWVALDRLERLVVLDDRVHFYGASDEPVPPVRFTWEKLNDGRGVALRYEMGPEERDRVLGVRLLDRALWIPSDSAEGGILLPKEGGQWLSAGKSMNGAWGLQGGALASEPAPEGVELFPGGPEPSPCDLALLGLLKEKNGLLIEWERPQTRIQILREPVETPVVPSGRALTTSLAFHGTEGSVRIRTLGLVENGPAVVPQAYRQARAGTAAGESLRYKTGFRPELRAFIGSALFRPTASAEQTFEQISSFARSLKDRLGVDQAAFVVSGWSGQEPGSDDLNAGHLLPALEAAGGDSGLSKLADTLRSLGFIFGLDVPSRLLDLPGLYGPDFVGPIQAGHIDSKGRALPTWTNRRAVALRPTGYLALKELCQPQLLLLEAGRFPAPARVLLEEYARETCGLAGALGPGSGELLPHSAYFEGALLPQRWWRRETEPWPFLAGALGQSVRMTVSADAALGPADAAAFLVHLLLGEVPLYAYPVAQEEPDGVAPDSLRDEGPQWCFAQEAGWASGKDLSRREIFLKNTYEVASHLARWRVRNALLFHRKLTSDGLVRESFFGPDMRIVINLKDENYFDETEDIILPPFGFVVRYPYLFAFHALRIHKTEYARPAFFVVRSLEGKMYLRAERVSIYHGFGPPNIRLGGREFTVERQTVTRIR